MLDQELHFLLLRAFHHSNRHVQQQIAKETGLCPGQPKILEYLLEHDGCIARDICRACVLDKSTMTSLLARMEKQNLIQKIESGDDRRAVHIYLTETGRTLVRKVKTACAKVDETALRGISPENRDVFLETLKQITANLEGGGA